MKKKTRIVTTTTDTAKRKLGTKKLAQKNLKESTKAIKANTPSTREVIYLYPAGCDTQEKRKEFRRKARAAARRNEKAIAQLEASTERGSKTQLQNVKKEFNAFKQTTYTNPN